MARLAGGSRAERRVGGSAFPQVQKSNEQGFPGSLLLLYSVGSEKSVNLDQGPPCEHGRVRSGVWPFRKLQRKKEERHRRAAGSSTSSHQGPWHLSSHNNVPKCLATSGLAFQTRCHQTRHTHLDTTQGTQGTQERAPPRSPPPSRASPGQEPTAMPAAKEQAAAQRARNHRLPFCLGSYSGGYGLSFLTWPL